MSLAQQILETIPPEFRLSSREEEVLVRVAWTPVNTIIKDQYFQPSFNKLGKATVYFKDPIERKIGHLGYKLNVLDLPEFKGCLQLVNDDGYESKPFYAHVISGEIVYFLLTTIVGGDNLFRFMGVRSITSSEIPGFLYRPFEGFVNTTRLSGIVEMGEYERYAFINTPEYPRQPMSERVRILRSSPFR